MFELTENARKELSKALQQQPKSADENYYIRLSMGMG